MRARTLPQLAAQLVNLLNLCLLHGASLFSSPDDLAELHRYRRARVFIDALCR